ncbi:hypothetical protein FGO68_gene8121 [Halteria grandinella]|uniref:Uncharacterized protein n=1 Tax=Halteria grandinella TaxID=5974 RepID=A0A8J8SV08_HALGN|nr:hypothetical protein FGO68_gene8121 [Halteria grandinella]
MPVVWKLLIKMGIIIINTDRIFGDKVINPYRQINRFRIFGVNGQKVFNCIFSFFIILVGKISSCLEKPQSFRFRMYRQSFISNRHSFRVVIIPIFKRSIRNKIIFILNIFFSKFLKNSACSFSVFIPGIQSSQKNRNIRIVGSLLQCLFSKINRF